MHAVGGSNHMPARYSNHRRAESTRRRAWLRGCLHSAQRDGKNCREAITASEPVWRAPPTFTDAILGRRLAVMEPVYEEIRVTGGRRRRS